MTLVVRTHHYQFVTTSPSSGRLTHEKDLPLHNPKRIIFYLLPPPTKVTVTHSLSPSLLTASSSQACTVPPAFPTMEEKIINPVHAFFSINSISLSSWKQVSCKYCLTSPPPLSSIKTQICHNSALPALASPPCPAAGLTGRSKQTTFRFTAPEIILCIKTWICTFWTERPS